MAGRLQDRIAIVVGAGQTPGKTVGNGRAVSILYAREGATVIAADRNLASAEETAEQIRQEGGEAHSYELDVTDEAGIAALMSDCADRYGRIDILHNNVGISLSGGDGPVTEITAEAYDLIMSVNLRSMVLTCKYALPIMRKRGSGVITNISSGAALTANPLVAYKLSKTGVVALTTNVAIANAEYGIRANCILPGLMDTPMAIENRVQKLGITADEVRAARQKNVPLKGRVGSAWDVAHASVFLALEEEAGFITGVALAIDGGSSLRVG